MTQKEAKAISLEVWQYLAEHPYISEKAYLPDEIYNKVSYFHGDCPLCNLFFVPGAECPRCPLERCSKGSFYHKWEWGNDSTRKAAAQKIVDAIAAWEPKEQG